MKDEWSSLRFQLSKGKGGSPHAPPFIYLRPWYKMMVLYNWINLKVEVSSCNLDGWRQIFQFPFIYSSIHPSFIIGETDLYSQICFLKSLKSLNFRFLYRCKEYVHSFALLLPIQPRKYSIMFEKNVASKFRFKILIFFFNFHDIIT